MNTRFTLEELTGALGVGWLYLLGLALGLHYLTDLFYALERFTLTAAWAILFTIPLIVVAYILGLLSIIASEFLFDRIYRRRVSLTHALVSIAMTENTMLQQKFLESERHERLLKGSAPAFLLLALSSFMFMHGVLTPVLDDRDHSRLHWQHPTRTRTYSERSCSTNQAGAMVSEAA